MPGTVAKVIAAHSEATKPKLCRSHYEVAKKYFDELIEQDDPYSATLSRASARLSELIKRA